MIRATIAAALVAGLDDRYAVYGYPRNPDAVTGTTRPVCVWTDSVDRGVTLRAVAVTAVVWVLTGRTTDDDATEDELEESLADVLAVLDESTHPGQTFVWRKATRGVLEDTWHGYRIDISAAGVIEPATAPDPLVKE